MTGDEIVQDLVDERAEALSRASGPPLLTKAQAAEILGMPTWRLYQFMWIAGAVRIGNRIRLRRSVVEMWAQPWGTWRGAHEEHLLGRSKRPTRSFADRMRDELDAKERRDHAARSRPGDRW